jgi:prevent-host-death family protein
VGAEVNKHSNEFTVPPLTLYATTYHRERNSHQLARIAIPASSSFKGLAMLTMPSVEAQNSFGALIDKAQRQIISITRRGRPVAYVMSPEVMEDHIDGQLATQAEAEGFLGVAASNTFLNQFRHV